MILNSTKQIKSLLEDSETIAVVGISNKSNRPSYGVTQYMINAGYEIYPVNPKLDSVFDIPCFPNLISIEKNIDIVNIFRRSEHVQPIIEEAIRIKAKAVWMQLGVVNQQAARLAEEAGLYVIMNRCIKIEHSLMLGW
jgi:predicted CoA-binding protein